MQSENINGLVKSLDKVIKSKTNGLSKTEIKTLKDVKTQLKKSLDSDNQLDAQDTANLLQLVIIIIELMKAASP